MLCDVESACSVRVIVTAAEELPQYGVVPERANDQRCQLSSAAAGKVGDARFLDTLGFDVPSCEIILQHANKSFLGFGALFRAEWMVKGRFTLVQRDGCRDDTRKTGNKRVLGHSGDDIRIPLPKDEVRVGHEVRDTFEHTARLEHECRERHLGEVHTYSGNGGRGVSAK